MAVQQDRNAAVPGDSDNERHPGHCLRDSGLLLPDCIVCGVGAVRLGHAGLVGESAETEKQDDVRGGEAEQCQ